MRGLKANETLLPVLSSLSVINKLLTGKRAKGDGWGLLWKGFWASVSKEAVW